MIWLHQHWLALRLALLRLGAAPLNSLLSVLAIGVALALPAGGQWLVDNGVRLARASAPTSQLSLYLKLEATPTQVAAVRDKLAALSGIAKADFVAREQTLERFRTTEGLRDVIDVLPRNPFPHAFVLAPRDDAPAALEPLAATLRGWSEVDHVQFDTDWVRRLDALLRFARSTVLALGVLLGIGLVAITFNITRMQVLVQREEIVVSELLGATRSYVRRPFLYFGAVLGLAGGLLACALVLAGGFWLGEPLTELARLYGLNVQMQAYGPGQALSLLSLAAGLGWLGTALSLRQHLTPA